MKNSNASTELTTGLSHSQVNAINNSQSKIEKKPSNYTEKGVISAFDSALFSAAAHKVC